MENLLLVAVFIIAWVEWWIYGKKGMALLTRSPVLLFWVSGEILLSILSGFALVDAFCSRSWIRMGLITAANVLGSMGGIATSGLIKWREQHDD